MGITAIYAGLLAVFFIILSVRVIGVRQSARVAVGDEGNLALRRRIRAHGNFAEYVPMAIVLMGLAEGLFAPPLLLHAMGVALVAGRLLHATGISRVDEKLWLRITGMTLTFAVIATGAFTCLVLGLPVFGKV